MCIPCCVLCMLCVQSSSLPVEGQGRQAPPGQAFVFCACVERDRDQEERDSGVSIFLSFMAAPSCLVHKPSSGIPYNKTLSRPRSLRCRKGAPGLHRTPGNVRGMFFGECPSANVLRRMFGGYGNGRFYGAAFTSDTPAGSQTRQDTRRNPRHKRCF